MPGPVKYSSNADGGERSVSVAVGENQANRTQNDLEVKPQRPVPQVIQIVRNPATHLLQGVGFPAETIHLGPAGDAGPDLVPHHVGLDDLAILFVMRNSMRPRPDDAHASF